MGFYDSDVPARVIRKVANLLKKYFTSGDGQFIEELETILEDYQAIALVDPVRSHLYPKLKRRNTDRVLELSHALLTTSSNAELVKIIIAVVGLFRLGNDHELVETIMTLATCDEFTLYAAVAATNWEHGNDIVFAMAQRVDGWGKIQAVRILQSETDEIRDWLLHEGCMNNIMSAYLGLECAVKCDLISILRQGALDSKTFDSVSTIIVALLDEGPVSGISEYEYAEEALMLYLAHAEQHAKTMEYLWNITQVYAWAQYTEVEFRDAALASSERILKRDEWDSKLIDAVRTRDAKDMHHAYYVASQLNIDLSDEIFLAVKEEPLKHYGYLSVLFQDADKVTELISLYEATLPLEEMAEGMGDYLFSKKLADEHYCLDVLLQELGAYPCQGVALIMTGLNSPVIRSRNLAGRALLGWMDVLKLPLGEISSELFAEVQRIDKIEVDDSVKETITGILQSS